ncbi:hypothetical protein FACS189414_4840 [Bacteroidia bacterium]|nr:hypothetical protein FACS189414_4840 [Bacteroidia bacterium]
MDETTLPVINKEKHMAAKEYLWMVENPTQTDPLSLIQTDPPLRFKLTHPADSN